MNETLTALIFESLIAPTLTSERLVMEHVMLMAILHANVGMEVGKYFYLWSSGMKQVLRECGTSHKKSHRNV